MKKTLTYSLFLALFLFVSCSNDEKDILQIEDLIKENAQADTFEDIDRFMATLDESFPQFATLKEMKRRLYNDWDFNYRIEKIVVRNIKDNKATADVIKLISKKKGLDFIDNRNYLEYSLIKTKEIWKISQIIIKKSDKVRKSS